MANWDPATHKRCNQCWRVRPLARFAGRIPGRVYQDCDACRARHRKPVAEHRRGLPAISPLRVSIIPRSKNRKLGPIPEVYVTASTCPRSCPHYNAGCYGESHLTREHWRRVERAGVDWAALTAFVAALPERALWRYAVVGDLPGVGEAVDGDALAALIAANSGRRGWGYSHKRSDDAVAWIIRAQQAGLMINFSADNLDEADRYAARGATVVTLPRGAPPELWTPGGRLVRVCPAQLGKTTCARCGMCWLGADRRPIVGFYAHGMRAREVSERCRLPVHAGVPVIP